jgi:hypothetical protein
MPWKEATFWIGLTVFGTGLYFIIEPYVSERMSKRTFWLALVVCLSGASAVAYSMYAYYVPTVPTPPVWLYLLILTWGLIGWDVYERHTKSDKDQVDPLSLQQRTFALAQRLRQFVQKHGPRPTLMKADGERDVDFIKRLIAKTQPWDDTISGDYYGFLFRPIQQIRGELAQKGLIDPRLDDNFRIERPKEENLKAVVMGLRFLASQLDA